MRSFPCAINEDGLTGFPFVTCPACGNLAFLVVHQFQCSFLHTDRGRWTCFAAARTSCNNWCLKTTEGPGSTKTCGRFPTSCLEVLVHPLFLWCFSCPCSSTSVSVFLCDSSGLRCRFASDRVRLCAVLFDVCGFIDCFFSQHSEFIRVVQNRLSAPKFPALSKFPTCPVQLVVMSLFPSLELGCTGCG